MFKVDSDEKEKYFSSLFRKYYPNIFNYVSRQIVNREIAEDLTS